MKINSAEEGALHKKKKLHEDALPQSTRWLRTTGVHFSNKLVGYADSTEVKTT